jgi:hypothetical protein
MTALEERGPSLQAFIPATSLKSEHGAFCPPLPCMDLGAGQGPRSSAAEYSSWDPPQCLRPLSPSPLHDPSCSLAAIPANLGGGGVMG